MRSTALRAVAELLVVGATSLLVFLNGCGGESVVGTPVERVTCGRGTHAESGMCLPDPATPATPTTRATPVTPTPPAEAPTFTSIDVTHLAVRYDLSQPVYAGNTIPVSIGITARGDGPAVPRQVYFSLDLLDEAPPGATPEQLRALERCGLGVFDVSITPDGREQIFSREFHVPPQCAVPAAGQRGRAYNLAVVIDSVSRYQPADLTAFTERERAVPTSRANRCRNDAAPTSTTHGCVYRLQVEPAPGVNIAMQGLEPDSRVAVLWARPEVTVGSGVRDPSAVAAVHPDQRPLEPGEDALATVNMRLESFGLDPYAHSDADNALPGPVALTYRIAPTSGLISEGWPLTMRARDRGLAQTTLSEEFSELGTDETNHRVHDLYPTDAVYNLLTYGAWRRETQFRIQGCAVPTFREGGNLGSVEMQRAGASLAQDNCREFTVRLVRASAAATEARTAAMAFNFTRTWGSTSVEALTVALNTNNAFDVATGAGSASSALINTTGLVRFTLFNAYLNLDARRAITGSGYAYGLTLFGVSLARGGEVTNGSATWTRTIARDDSFTREKCINYTYPVGFGINLTLEGCVSGTMGLASSATITGTAYLPSTTVQSTEFPGASAVLSIVTTARPHLEIGLSASAGVSLGIDWNILGFRIRLVAFEGALHGELDLLSFSMPIVPSLRFGFYASVPVGTSTRPEIRIAGGLSVDGALEYMGGRVYITGAVGCWDFTIFRRRQGHLWSGEMNLFNFTAQREARNYSRTAQAAVTLY